MGEFRGRPDGVNGTVVSLTAGRDTMRAASHNRHSNDGGGGGYALHTCRSAIQ
jgi:hypothetical protein